MVFGQKIVNGYAVKIFKSDKEIYAGHSPSFTVVCERRRRDTELFREFFLRSIIIGK